MKNILLAFTLLVSYFTGNAQGTRSRLEIDHIIIMTEKEAPETKLFEQNGFAVSPFGSVMKGIGAGARFINFIDVFFELLYVSEQAGLNPRFDKVMPPLRDKWRTTGASPFGLSLSIIPYDTTQIPFEAKKVQFEGMPPNTGLFFATSNLSYPQEPSVVVTHPSMTYIKPEGNTIEQITKDIEQWSADEEVRSQHRKSFQHANGVQRLTNLKITCKTKELSSTIKALANVKNCQVVKGKEHLMEITFDENRQKKTADFRPGLPIVIKY
jgi:hypothetical protein